MLVRKVDLETFGICYAIGWVNIDLKMKNNSQKNPSLSSVTRFPERSNQGIALLLSLLALLFFTEAQGAGVLKPVGSDIQSLEIRDHQVHATLNNGFARTEIVQSFYNPSQETLEAIYSFPLPEHASLSEMTLWAGEAELQGEVVKAAKAEQIYEEETANGNEAGLAKKDSYQRFEFRVYPVPAASEIRMRVVYYQPLELDTGIGSYKYPLEEGGTDQAAEQFWTRTETVSGHFSIEVEVKSAWPLKGIRTPGYQGTQSTDAEGDLVYSYQSTGGDLTKDFILYYMLEDSLPGRVEVIPYRDSSEKAGTFMMVVTPGVDLQPLTGGSDYIFVLDVSGSMKGKLHTLLEGVRRTIDSFRPEDRFRIVLFNNEAQEMTRGWITASESEVSKALSILDTIQSGGGTNLYAGLDIALRDMDDDRATSVILVTDGVTNTGQLSPKAFAELMAKNDIRVFGFLLGNSANWPLMKTICEASGGFYKSVSNSDDIIGQILLAKSKVLFESMHNVELSISGVKTFDVSPMKFRKVYRGQQLVLFGRYANAGRAKLRLSAGLTGADKEYVTEFDFPERDTLNPEIERLWAMDTIETLEWQKSIGYCSPAESESAITDLALQYQLVTDYTSMVVLEDEAFARHGIERRNQKRVAIEYKAQSERNRVPVANRRVDQNQPLFDNSAPRIPSNGNGGGGAVHPFAILGILLLVVGKRLIGRKS